MRSTDNKLRSISEQERRSLKGATGAAITLAGGNSVVERLSRAVTSQLSKYAAFDESDDEKARNYVPLDIAVEIDRAAKSPVILEVQAEILGYRVVPGARARGVGEITDTTLLALLCETHDVHRVIMEARAAGRLDALDRRRIAKEIHEAMRELRELLDIVGDG